MFNAAAATGTVLEINAQPLRLDLENDLVKMAVRKGVRLVINTDAHALSQFDFMQIGVGMARRAGCCKQDILNTVHWDEIARFKKGKLNVRT